MTRETSATHHPSILYVSDLETLDSVRASLGAVHHIEGTLEELERLVADLSIALELLRVNRAEGGRRNYIGRDDIDKARNTDPIA